MGGGKRSGSEQLRTLPIEGANLAARLRQGALAAAARFTPAARASALHALYAQVQA